MKLSRPPLLLLQAVLSDGRIIYFNNSVSLLFIYYSSTKFQVGKLGPGGTSTPLRVRQVGSQLVEAALQLLWAQLDGRLQSHGDLCGLGGQGCQGTRFKGPQTRRLEGLPGLGRPGLLPSPEALGVPQSLARGGVQLLLRPGGRPPLLRLLQDRRGLRQR